MFKVFPSMINDISHKFKGFSHKIYDSQNNLWTSQGFIVYSPMIITLTMIMIFIKTHDIL